MIHINQRGYPTDVRIAPEIKSLTRAGHEVAVLTFRRAGEARDEVVDGTRILRFNILEDFRGAMLKRKVVSLRDRIFFLNPWWRDRIIDVCRDYDAIHVHDLPYVRTAVSAGRALGIPVVFDMHENYPGMIELGYRSGTSPRRDNIPFLFGRLSRYELDACRSADFIVTVVEESRARLISLGIPPGKIIVAENTMDRELFDGASIDESLTTPFKDRFVITYLGGISELRGVGTVIEAIPEIAESIPNILFLVVGGWENSGAERKFRKLAADLGVSDRVAYTGLVRQDLIPTYLSATDIGLVPHQVSVLTNSTLPHKLFDYMLMKKPIIVTDCAPLRRIVEEVACGLVVPDGRSDLLAQAVDRLADRERAAALGEKGYAAALDKYNWEESVKPLLALYSETLSTRTL
ncbi:glycosyltransferase family 4 protein [Thermodesulfobacteriota bacterium]